MADATGNKTRIAAACRRIRRAVRGTDVDRYPNESKHIRDYPEVQLPELVAELAEYTATLEARPVDLEAQVAALEAVSHKHPKK